MTPEQTDRETRVYMLLRALPGLRRGLVEPAIGSWLAAALETHFQTGEPIDRALGVRAPRGSHRTPALIVDEERDASER